MKTHWRVLVTVVGAAIIGTGTRIVQIAIAGCTQSVPEGEFSDLACALPAVYPVILAAIVVLPMLWFITGRLRLNRR